MSGKVEFKNVDEYFDAQPENTRKALLELKECILKAEPNATELLNYNIPAYALVENGKREQQIMIAGYKKHVGLYPHPTTMEKFDSELSEYKRAKGSVQFPLDKPFPKELIVRMIKYRIGLLKK
ncbi:MAG: iron chaperone [Aestuariibaculum sp.]